MPQPASVVIEPVAIVLNDEGHDDWTEPELLHWTNDAMRAIALVKPGAFAKREKWQLVAGFKQSLPAGALQILGPLYNMGADGNTPGRAILLGDREIKDRFEPSWRSANGATTIREYFYDVAREPKVFEVSPPAGAATPPYVEATLAVVPAEIDGAEEDLPCDDIYIPAAIQWVIGCAFSKDEEQTPNFQRASRAFSMFFNLLGIKPRTELIAAPKVRQILEPPAQTGG